MKTYRVSLASLPATKEPRIHCVFDIRAETPEIAANGGINTAGLRTRNLLRKTERADGQIISFEVLDVHEIETVYLAWLDQDPKERPNHADT